MRYTLLLCLLMVMTVNQVTGASQIQKNYLERIQMVRQWADTTEHENFLTAATKIRYGRNPEAGIDAFETLLQKKISAPANMFDMYTLMIGFHATKDKLPAELRDRIRDYMAIANFYRGDTENHLVMYYTGLYLAAQAFPDLPADQWYTGKSSPENKKEALTFFDEWINLTTTRGQGEFDSPTYMSVYLAPLFGLAQWTEDPDMKAKANAMLLWLLADYAVEHLKGLYTGAHSREYPERLILSKHPASLMNGWGWLLFDQTGKPMFNETLVSACLSDWVLPDIIYHIGTDRDEPYTHTETKRVRHVLRLGDARRNPPVYKITHMTSDYALGSMMGGRILQPIQQHTWDVSYVNASSPYSTIFTVHPYKGTLDMGMFFPEERKFATDMVVTRHTYYGDEGKWSASSPYEKTFQHENAIIVLYNIPEDVEFGHIDGFFPIDLPARDEDPTGWIFCDTGNTYVAYFPLQPYTWLQEEHGYRLRSMERKNGCVVEVAQATEYDSFDAFKKQIRSNTLATDTFNSTLMVSYTNSSGDVLTFTYDGARRLNGTPIDYSTYRMFNGPFLSADLYEQRLVIRHQDDRMILDLSKDQPPYILTEN